MTAPINALAAAQAQLRQAVTDPIRHGDRAARLTAARKAIVTAASGSGRPSKEAAATIATQARLAITLTTQIEELIDYLGRQNPDGMTGRLAVNAARRCREIRPQLADLAMVADHRQRGDQATGAKLRQLAAHAIGDLSSFDRWFGPEPAARP